MWRGYLRAKGYTPLNFRLRIPAYSNSAALYLGDVLSYTTQCLDCSRIALTFPYRPNNWIPY